MGGPVKNTLGRVGLGVVTGGMSEFAQKNPFLEGAVKNPLAPNNPFFQQNGLFGGNSATSQAAVPGPFSLDPNQYAQDKADITGLGNKQYADTLGAISDTGTAETQRAKDLFGQMLPDIAENAQASHLYDSTGYGQEVARQQSNIASQVAEQEAQQKLSALGGRQGFETGALQRGQSLEDFINQANVAKTIGAQMAPQPASGKQNFGTVAQGIGAIGGPAAKLATAGKGG